MPALTPRRHVEAPHPDVQSGRYLQAEFAANLADVRRGQDKAEYREPLLPLSSCPLVCCGDAEWRRMARSQGGSSAR